MLNPPEKSGEPVAGNVIGVVVTPRGQAACWSVFDGNGRAPDISKLKAKQIWILTYSCMSPSCRVIRQLKYHKVLLLWDYKGKLESRGFV